MCYRVALVLITCLLPLSTTVFAELPIPENPQWEVIADVPYLQEASQKVASDTPLHAVAVYGGAVYVGGPAGLGKLSNEGLVVVPEVTGAVTQLHHYLDVLWVVGDGGVWGFDGTEWKAVSAQPVADLCVHNGHVVGLQAGMVYDVSFSGLLAMSAAPAPGPPLQGIASYSGTLYVHNGSRLGILDKGKFAGQYLADWGQLPPGAVIRDMLAVGSRLVVATERGLATLRGATWYRTVGTDGLPVEDTTTLTTGFDRDLWIGSRRGAMRQVDDEFHYFGHQRWLPDNHVNAIAVDGRTVYIATDGGLGIIGYVPFTLAKKAAWYERWMEEWGHKRLGFVHSLVKQDGEWVRHISDNDVGYSSHYFNALCYKYAVTGDEAVRAEALDMLKSVKWSEEITPMDGFPARSIWAVGDQGDKAKHGSGGLPAEWHRTEDDKWEWKGDTSSDEMVAQHYETSLFLDLIATEEERVWATEHIDRLMSHLLDNGFVLRDVDGEPTRWARWDPAYLMDPKGFAERGLNALQALSYMASAYHHTGDKKFLEGKAQLVEWGYLDQVLRQKRTFHPGYFTWFDDRLAFLAYGPLLRYETDPDLRSLYLRSLERSWEVKRVEQLPWFNFVYGAATGNDCETEASVKHLREWPLDLREYSYTNSHRDDLHAPEGYRMYSERLRSFSPRETRPARWDDNWLQMDRQGGGNSATEPGGWLEAYWMGRYYGMITAPQTDDAALLTVEQRGLELGAKPYTGPGRPKLNHEE